jgi:hypothetical protein
MFGSTALDVAIGVIFLFVFISLIATSIREALEGILKTRALDLERGIREILSDPDGKSITKMLYDHPLISALFAGNYDPDRLTRSPSFSRSGEKMHMRFSYRRNLPTYIPAANFAEALLDITARGAIGELPIAEAVSKELSIDSLRQSVEKLPNGGVQRAVLSALDYAQGDIDKAKANIAAWFDSSMDRVSGWYKRRTQAILFVIGLVAAVALNIDTITVTRALIDDATLRSVVVAEAQKTVAAGSVEALGTDIKTLKGTLITIGFPMGWPARQFEQCGSDNWCSTPGSAALTILLMVAGWLVTAFATMLGAPFWFDLLDKLVAIRAAGNPPKKSDGTASGATLPR